MKLKDPIWNFFNTLNDKKKQKKTSVRCLDCNAKVSAIVLRLMMDGWMFELFIDAQPQ